MDSEQHALTMVLKYSVSMVNSFALTWIHSHFHQMDQYVYQVHLLVQDVILITKSLNKKELYVQALLMDTHHKMDLHQDV